jgi:hypothetical protein
MDFVTRILIAAALIPIGFWLGCRAILRKGRYQNVEVFEDAMIVLAGASISTAGFVVLIM